MDMCTDSEGVYPKGPTNPDPDGPWPAAASELGQCTALLAALGACLFGAALFGSSGLGALLSYGAMLLQLWGPMALADRARVGLWALGLHRRNLGRQLGHAALVAACVLPLWALALQQGAPLWRQWGLMPAFAAHGGGHGVMGWWAMAEHVASQLLGIALPEELFWRGYVQPVLQSAWSRRTGVACGLFNGGTALTTALFAAGHVLGGAGWASLATVFPGLLFAMLRNRDRSIVGPIALHWACNVAAAVVLAYI